MSTVIKGSCGTIEISRELIGKLAGIATMECVGIVGMVSSRAIRDGITEILGKEALSKGVDVDVKDGNLAIKVNVVVAYGIPISVTANNVIEHVRYIVQRDTELKVSRVDVNIQGVRVVD